MENINGRIGKWAYQATTFVILPLYAFVASFIIKSHQFFVKKQKRNFIKIREKDFQFCAVSMKKIGFHHRYIMEVDCSLSQFKSAKLKDKEYTIKAPSF